MKKLIVHNFETYVAILVFCFVIDDENTRQHVNECLSVPRHISR